MTSAPAELLEARERTRRPPWRTVPGALVILLLGYVLVIALGDARAFSGSDAGGKLATVAVMADRGTLVPDVGYWAEEADPAGRHHPLWNTTAMGDHWVQATSLPFVVAAVPLYALGGPAGALVLPVAGGLLAAVAARRLSRLLDGSEGWAAFWLVGAAGPALFYAGDFWEHAPALGVALLAIALALEDDRSPEPRAGTGRRVAAGLLAGVAVVLRAEMALYGVAFIAATLAVGPERRRWSAAPRRLLGLGLAAALPVLANGIAERLLLADGVRDGRAAESLSGTGAHASSRATDALVTSVGLFPDDRPLALALGTVLVAALLVVGAHLARPALVSERAAIVAGAVAGLLYLFRFSSGPGFAPGFVVAAPLAAVGVFAADSPKARVLLGTALGALPLVWLTAWSGNHLAQWGGRYLLLSGALLTILAVGAAHRVGWGRPPVVLVLALTVCVALLGAAWHIERTRTIARAVAVVEDRPVDVVLLSDAPHLARDAGAWYGDHRWLRTDRPGGVAATAATARQAGADDLATVQVVAAGAPEPSAPTLAGFRLVGTPERVPYLLGEHLLVRRYTSRS